MATLDSLTTEQIQLLAQQLTGWVPDFDGYNKLGKENTAPEILSIGEVIPLRLLDFNDMVNESVQDSECLIDQGKWHLQIYRNNIPQYFSHIKVNGNSTLDTKVLSFYQSPLALSIDNGLNVIEHSVADNNAKVYLLEIPSHLITALLILQQDEYSAIIVDMPNKFDLFPLERYSIGRLRNILSNIDPIIGIVENES